MHRATDKLPQSVLAKVKAVVMFGDPYAKLGGLGQFKYPLRTRALGICAKGDPVSRLWLPFLPLLLCVDGDCRDGVLLETCVEVWLIQMLGL